MSAINRHTDPSSSGTRKAPIARVGCVTRSWTNGQLLGAKFLGGGLGVIDVRETPTSVAGAYEIITDGTLASIGAGVPDPQIDTCWLVNNGRYACGSNYASGTILSFTFRTDGGLTLLEYVAGETDDLGNTQGTTPLDERISADGRFLYVVLPGAGKVGGWQIADDGSLSKLGEFAGLPRAVDGDHGPFDFSALGSPAGIEAI